MKKTVILIALLAISFVVNAHNRVASDSILISYLKAEGMPFTQNNQITLLTSGREKFDDLLQAISEAKHHIHLEYFNFRNDSIAVELFGLLVQKASEGVEIRALFDAFGNSSNNKPLKNSHLKSIRKRGIEIVKFDPFNFPWINHAFARDHRKIVVIDGVKAYIGGMNIADYYISGLPELGDWRDIHMRIEGDAVRYLQGIFLNMWNDETKQHIGGPAYFPATTDQTDGISEPLAIVDRRPHKSPASIRDSYSEAILTAENKIQIINPYFNPTSKVRKALKKALKNGTEIEIMIPAVSDIPFTPEASFHICHKLMKRGAKIYLFNGGFHHSKVMMVDSTYCTVGSANLNSRSLRYDFETNAFIFHTNTTHQLINIFEKDKLNSTLMTPEYWKKRSRWKKFVGAIGNLLTPFI